MARTASILKSVAGVMLASALLAGCANEGGSDNGDPGARPLAAGQTCQSVRAELNALDKKGTQAKVEAASQGKKLQPKDKAEVDRYNELLNQYLGARCHV
ncbi:MAG: hypothetical protein EKK41_17080 [Hyphomicrobiales bacterium]|nr:MAG: hypothetical protein EKK41_17080 [Hyphomicrobiales bacterium]